MFEAVDMLKREHLELIDLSFVSKAQDIPMSVMHQNVAVG